MLVLAKADAVHDVLRAGIITSGTLSQCPLRGSRRATAFISRGAAVSQSVRERGRQRERERGREREESRLCSVRY